MSTTNIGTKALASPDQAITTIANTLCALSNAQPKAKMHIPKVEALIKNGRSILLGMRSWVNAAEELRIKESAVDSVAAKIPAKIKPTSTGGNRVCAIVGNANSASKLPTSGKYRRDSKPTVVAIK